jgi:hypothetical protein
MKNFLIITAIIMLLTGFYDWYIPIIIVLSLLLSYMLLYLSVRFLMGIIFVPLRQNQFFAIKGVGDTDKTATGNGNLVNIVGYAIEIVKKRKQGRLTDVKIFITFSFKNGEKIESDKNPYHWIWLFIGGYPALWPKIHLMAKYNFGWGKILVGKDKLVDPRNEIVDSFFYSYIYGITVQVPTLDRQSLEITYRVPLKLKNFIIAYCCLPTGDWLKKYNAAFYAGTKFYTSQKNSKDLLKEDYVYNRPFVIPTTPSVPLKPSDLLGTLYEQYLPDTEKFDTEYGDLNDSAKKTIQNHRTEMATLLGLILIDEDERVEPSRRVQQLNKTQDSTSRYWLSPGREYSLPLCYL